MSSALRASRDSRPLRAWCQALLCGLVLAFTLSVPLSAQVTINAIQPIIRAAPLTTTTCPASYSTTSQTPIDVQLSSTGCLVLPLGGYASISVQIRDDAAGTWAGIFEVTSDGSATPTWQTLALTNVATSASVTTPSAAAAWAGTAVGRFLRVRLTSISSGTPIAMLRATLGGGGGAAGGGGGGGGGNVTVIGPLGQTTMAASIPVTVASNQGNIPVSQATAANLNATVVGTGTFVTQSSITGTLPAFAATPGVNLAQYTPNGDGGAPVHVNNGSATATEAATYATGVANAAQIIDWPQVYGSGGTTTWARLTGASAALNSTGTGIVNANLVAQFNNTTPTSITEAQFGNLRISANRNLFGTLRDAAGNERGANVTAANELVVGGSGTAGTASANVVSVQGIAAMTPILATATLNAETTKVIGTVRAQGNLGAAFDAATGAAPPANAIQVGGIRSGATGGFLGGITVCDLNDPITITTATTTLEITGVAGRQVRICAINLVTNAANNVALIEGTGATCGTGTAGIAGGTTAATGWNFGANSGIAQGSGFGEIMATTTAGDSVCLITSATTTLAGFIKYTVY